MKNFNKAILFIIILIFTSTSWQQPSGIKHYVVAIEKGKVHGWPANNGIWIWGNEILVGFTQTDYEETESHNIKNDSPLVSKLARSLDGGKTWMEEFIVRDDFYTREREDMKDLGYCRIVQNSDGEIVAIYYWATKENPEQHIAASIWKP